MLFSDEENGSEATAGATADAAPADFGRWRVGRILKRERPRDEQDRERYHYANYLLEHMFCRHKFRHEADWSWLGQSHSFEVYCMWRRVVVSAGAGGIRWRKCYDLKKAGAANIA